MNKVALAKSISRQYLSRRSHIRKNKKAMSSFKLVFVAIFLALVLGRYAKEVNEGSTAGYFLDQEMRTYQKRQFDYSVIKLDILQLERDLWQATNQNRNYWYDHTDRIVTVPTWTTE